MKNYGNIVLKYVPAKLSHKYDAILADGLDDYHTKQLADLERFMKEDFKVTGTADNLTHHSNSIFQQGEFIKSEIARLKAQVDNIGIAEKKIKVAKKVQKKAAKHIAKKDAAEKVERVRKSMLKREKDKAEAEARAEAESPKSKEVKKKRRAKNGNSTRAK